MAGCKYAVDHRSEALPTLISKATRSHAFAKLCSFFALAAISQTAWAQQDGPSATLDFYRPQTLISPNVPSGFDRGGNISIDQMGHPGYDPQPIQIGSFDLYPSVETFVGGTSNVLLSRSDPKPDLLLGAAASLYAKADWGSNSFVLIARDWENVWAHNAVRSQDQGNIDASYQFGITDELTGAVEGGFSRYGDNNPIGMYNNLDAILQMTQRSFMGARIQYESGHFSEMVSVDRMHFNLDPIYSQETGLELTYFDDHTVERITSQTEYAFTPAVAIFAQFSGYKTSYSTILPDGLPNYGSFSLRGIFGLSLDIPGVLRGQVSAGFAHRNYDYQRYITPTGFIVATKVEFFPDQMNNFTLTVLKDFDDGSIYSSTPVKYNTISLAYEHVLRANITLGSQFNFFSQKVVNQGFYSEEDAVKGLYAAPVSSSNYGMSVYANVIASRHFSIRAEVGGERFLNHSSDVLPDNQTNTEFRGILTFVFRP